ncbi:hypothetical protein BU25DRAFT_463557 [Macroventuria anomochaeta]|uniref:Uncharacterized protein n=1 Tax=Macroventuria anomochaeta TaxID=301207 RepID=A0ACB6RI69_9PLEO|nr:uncharacterized protein BU25DRAFT_463557 [Macroventuria anomochaeta]KAF2621600.1 hypothetical protein BU25DRAFT_463557 [Macroventuria anomochaeta]
MVQKLVGYVNLETGTVFPKIRPQHEVNQSWTAFYEYIVLTVSSDNITLTVSVLSVGCFACSAKNIAYGCIPGSQLKAYIESLFAILKSPHAQQTLFSTLFCRWTLAIAESILSVMHSDGMMHQYDVMLASQKTNADGVAKVQQYDKVAARLLFEGPDFRNLEVTRRISEFKSQFQPVKEKLCQKSDIPNYRIHYVRPGTKFDASWKQAYKRHQRPNSRCKGGGEDGSAVFSALICQEPEALKESGKLEDVLCKNQRFFPTFEEIVRGRVPGSTRLGVVSVRQDRWTTLTRHREHIDFAPEARGDWTQKTQWIRT